MKINARKTHCFTEIKVDEIETTIYSSDKGEAQELINDMLYAIECLQEYIEKEE